jgi:hypothetical protein
MHHIELKKKFYEFISRSIEDGAKDFGFETLEVLVDG